MREIDQWLKSGAEVPEGLRLLNIVAPNPHLERMVRRDPVRFRQLLIRTLSRFASEPGAAEPVTADRSFFRESWPFLSEPDCPAELKILAADKITAYRAFARYHEKLFDCSTMEECLETAKKVVENYSKNRKIHYEFCYYKEHGHVLGKHPVFAESRRMDELRSMGIRDLVKNRDNLKKSIYRLAKQIRDGGREDLAGKRADLLSAKQRQFAEVERMIRAYEDTR